MEFTYSEEQEDLRRTVRAFLERGAPLSEVLRTATEGGGHDRRLWQRMAGELGLHGLALPVEYGGAGFGPVELGAVLEETGRALLCAPFFSSVVLAAQAVVDSADKAAAAALLPGIASGDTVAVLALTGDCTGDGPALPVRAVYRAGEWRLTGTVRPVPDLCAADRLLVPARTEDGIGLFSLSSDTPGVGVAPLPSLDPTRPVGVLDLADAAAEPLGEPGNAWPGLRHTLDVALAALAAEQVGGAAAVLDMSVAHASTRHQFGRPIGGFQAIKHHCANMLVDIESARATAHYGLLAAEADAPDLPLAASAAKAFCSAAFTRCAETTIQIHGGIGFTWEHPAHLYLKRAKATEAFLGSPRAHLEAVAVRAGI
ncbi:acyl-CoA dehydrogenase family protein [Peterkaempfera bronchialis]|uniref:Acyl-CoA dehydrogenase n=1 Tax=Peterkaempfera bronchialis TaxID=2126346 RepID=A0A345SR08_9ACTN|nr:acyl-CoA dehydrogenase family protein [Peterkaempfera bronchialis]AXI76163.1 acyl-CoA dehydrogenase [Peterkaempfera bronchialis]